MIWTRNLINVHNIFYLFLEIEEFKNIYIKYFIKEELNQKFKIKSKYFKTSEDSPLPFISHYKL